MRNFLEFYFAMLGFINFHLLGKVNLHYPLKPAHIPKEEGDPKNRDFRGSKKNLDKFKNLMSLNFPLERMQSTAADEEDIDSLHLLLVAKHTLFFLGRVRALSKFDAIW